MIKSQHQVPLSVALRINEGFGWPSQSLDRSRSGLESFDLIGRHSEVSKHSHLYGLRCDFSLTMKIDISGEIKHQQSERLTLSVYFSEQKKCPSEI